MLQVAICVQIPFSWNYKHSYYCSEGCSGFLFCCVVQLFSHEHLFATPWTAACQASLSFTQSPKVCLNSCPLSQWYHSTISLSPPSPSALNLSQHGGLFQWVSSLHQVAKVLLKYMLKNRKKKYTLKNSLKKSICLRKKKNGPRDMQCLLKINLSFMDF